MRFVISDLKKKLSSPPHPTYQSKGSRNRVIKFLSEEKSRTSDGYKINLGSGNQRLESKILNFDLFLQPEVDIQGDLLHLPFKNETLDTIICTGVLEHVSDPREAVNEIQNALKRGGRVYLETPFMQTIHAVPNDFSRWTPSGLKELMNGFEIKKVDVVAGPASALAWQFQETMAMLFSFNNELIYKLGLRIFGWLSVPISWFDIILEKNIMAWRAASGYALVAKKK